MPLKRFGKNPSGKRQERIQTAPNYYNGAFHNVELTTVMRKDVSSFTVFKEFFTKPKTVSPSRELPNVKTDLFNIKENEPAVVWFGHSSYFIKAEEFTILVDPVFSGNASPVSFFGKAFKGADNYHVEDFPDIDLLIITHDHYDHLDYKTIKKIKSKLKRIVTSLGVGEHLEYWGVEKEKITELNWGENCKITSAINITALASRHFSGRNLQRFKTLWSSFALQLYGYKIFIGGDSGYSAQYKKIGEQFGGFDLAFLECGQYGKHWPQIHMRPEETVQAAADLNAQLLFPVHWSKFVLSTHPWNGPIKRLVVAAEKQKQQYVSPLIGEVYVLGENFEQKHWWDFE